MIFQSLYIRTYLVHKRLHESIEPLLGEEATPSIVGEALSEGVQNVVQQLTTLGDGGGAVKFQILHILIRRIEQGVCTWGLKK